MAARDVMEVFLRNLEHILKPSDDLIKKGRHIMDKIFKAIQDRSNWTNSRYSIDRCVLLGGAGKKTSTCIKVDFDCVVYVNNCRFPFDNIIDDIENILLKNFEIEEKDIKKTRHGVKVSIEDVDFDILIAENCLGPIQRPVATNQARGLLEKVKQSSNPGRMAQDNSAGFSESAVEFVRQKSSFCHKLARLCKYWNSTLYIDKYVSGRSSIIELLAIKAGENEERYAQNGISLLNGFRKFLVEVRKIEQLSLMFDGCFYTAEEVPREVRQQIPLLLDPSNPFNNYLSSIDRHVLNFFSDCAKETLKRLEVIESALSSYADPDFRNLFSPQPRQATILEEASWLVGTRSDSGDRIREPTKVIRRLHISKINMDMFFKIFVSTVKFVESAMMSKMEVQQRGRVAKEDIMEGVEKAISNDYIGNDRSWISTDKKHEDQDVTFYVPILNETDWLLVSIAFKRQ